jgi:signal transduction histidine kinase
LVAIRERAELLGGAVDFVRSPSGENGSGTLVRLTVPREKLDSHGG